MQFQPVNAAGTLLLVALLLISGITTLAHDITQILTNHPEYSTFNHYLTITHLAPEINLRSTVTVCTVDNAAMQDLLDKHSSIYTIKNILSLHVLLDYFGDEKLHQLTNGTALASTIFQATGTAPGSSGLVNITDLRGGKVGFGAGNGTISAYFVKSVEEIPYNISVIEISQVLRSDVAEAPTPAPSQQNLTAIMSKHGCSVFAETLLASDAEESYMSILEGGLTVFCPMDDAFKAFLPKYKNLTAAGKTALLEYHGVSVYQSLAMLKSNNGLFNTLATEGANNYDFTVQNDGEDVTLRTKTTTAKITGTIIDEQPLAIFTINKVLLPRELFKAEAPVPAPAPAPGPGEADVPAGDAPEPPKKKKPAPSSDGPADSPDDAAADDDNSAAKADGAKYVTLVVALAFGILLL